MKARRKLYTNAERDVAVTRVMEGETTIGVTRDTGIPAITLKRYLKRRRNNEPAHDQRRGTKPTLLIEAEEDIVPWVTAMQRDGSPIGREAILKKANDIHHRLHGSTRSVKDLTDGCYRRFRERHLRLAPRAAQKVSRARNSVDEGDLRTLFHTLAKLTIEWRLQPSQVFNMDETSFTSRTNTRKVIAVKGSPNVHTHAPETSFHLSFVATVAADGFAVPPLFIVPGMRVSWSILDECSIEGAAITTAPKGSINTSIFLKWITHFAYNIPDAVPRPLVLICDSCSSHVNLDTLERCEQLRILLVCLPPNAAHLVQPLDVAVFRPFKRGITSDITRTTTYTSATTISKATAIQIASKAFIDHVQHKQHNIVSGFKSTGLYPPSIDMMIRRLEKFNSSDTKRGDTLGSESWLQIRHEVRTEVLLLPPKRVKMPRKTTTVDVGGRLLTRALLAADQRKQPDTIRDPVGCTDVVV